ncbi:MAG: DEAD/DEAH box helicase, partial [Bacteroidota bacterium]|nr:DEAD/DEAH box helicase [Bacteroidota bacterium]
KHWIVEEKLQKLLNEKNDLVIKYIDTSYDERVRETIKKDRKSLKNLLAALKSRVGTTQAKYFASLNYESVFKVFPVWLVKMSDIYKVIPLFTEMFDYVIIDEATQSNIAQALPILQRGKKVIITGDPSQLRHFSFLSRAKQDIFKDKLGLSDVDDYITDYKNTSLLDVVSHSTQFGEQFVSLYEHFRSLPAIIRFSNKNFYENKLRIMTSKPGLSENLGIELVDCKGKRIKQGYNNEEAEIIISTLQAIIEDEKNLGINIASSVGILSPFRDQVENISKKIADTFSLDEIKKHKITINTAYGFQGDERDIMMLSFAVDNQTHATAFRYLNKEDVFNVSITRARKMQYVFYSIKPEKLKAENLLRQYLESFSTKKYAEDDGFVTDDFLDDVSDNLVEKGFQTWKNFKIAGLNIELIAKKNNKTVGIDLIGFPGQFAEAFTIERYKMLTRAGVDMFPLPYSYWINEKEFCLAEIEKAIK